MLCWRAIPAVFLKFYCFKGREDRRLTPVVHALEAAGVRVRWQQYAGGWTAETEGAVHQSIIAKVEAAVSIRNQ